MSAVDSIEGVMRREVGGLPVIAWAGIVGAGVIVGKRLGRGGFFGGGGGAATGTPTPFVDPNLVGYTATGEPATDGTIGGTGTRATYVDNNAWRRAALDYLATVGVAPVDAARAVGRYLTGDTLTAADVAIVNTVERAIGAPPEGVPVPTTAPPTTTPVPGTPRPVRYTTVKAPYGLGENLDQVAARIRRPLLAGGLGTTTTTDGRALTAAYLASINGLNVRTNVALRSGTRINY